VRLPVSINDDCRQNPPRHFPRSRIPIRRTLKKPARSLVRENSAAANALTTGTGPLAGGSLTAILRIIGRSRERVGTLTRLALEIDDTRLYPLTHTLITNKRTGNQCHRGQDAEDLLKHRYNSGRHFFLYFTSEMLTGQLKDDAAHRKKVYQMLHQQACSLKKQPLRRAAKGWETNAEPDFQSKAGLRSSWQLGEVLAMNRYRTDEPECTYVGC